MRIAQMTMTKESLENCDPIDGNPEAACARQSRVHQECLRLQKTYFISVFSTKLQEADEKEPAIRGDGSCRETSASPYLCLESSTPSTKPPLSVIKHDQHFLDFQDRQHCRICRFVEFVKSEHALLNLNR